jgi:C-terminal processing protease CtpA/Prc
MSLASQRLALSCNRVATLAFVGLIAGCGGGGGGDSNGFDPAPSNPPPSIPYNAGVFAPSPSLKNQCANPRTGTDARGRAFPDVQGSMLAENHWLRSWTNELYLWYREVPDFNPANYSSTAAYFDLLKTTQTTASGAKKDNFHGTLPTAEWLAFSQSGVSVGYGATFVLVEPRPPRKVVVALVEPGSAAANAGLLRGDTVLTVGSTDIDSNDTDALDRGLFPTTAGTPHTFQIRSGGVSRSVTLTAGNVTSTPVHTVTTIPATSGLMGYILFNDHIAPSEAQLIEAINTLRGQNVVDLVLDLRYNGGGLLDVASELSYMIAGQAKASGQTFERIQFNDKHTATDPVTLEPLAATPFHSRTQGFSTAEGVALPSLNAGTVYVLTSGNTCSASEAIINGLRGIDVPVVQIGTTTCGKPYGFYPFDNCGTTYFSIQFKGVNAQNFGEYSDGFSPVNTVTDRGEPVAGCSVAEDFQHQLGNPAEKLLSVAINYAQTGQCGIPPAAVGQQKRTGGSSPVNDGLTLRRPAWRDIRVYKSVTE